MRIRSASAAALLAAPARASASPGAVPEATPDGLIFDRDRGPARVRYPTACSYVWTDDGTGSGGPNAEARVPSPKERKAQALYGKAPRALLTVSRDPACGGTRAAERALGKLAELGGM